MRKREAGTFVTNIEANLVLPKESVGMLFDAIYYLEGV